MILTESLQCSMMPSIGVSSRGRLEPVTCHTSRRLVRHRFLTHSAEVEKLLPKGAIAGATTGLVRWCYNGVTPDGPAFPIEKGGE